MQVDTEELVGVVEIADLLNVQVNTVNKWIQRGLLPPPVLTLRHCVRVWVVYDVLDWAHRSQRLDIPA